MTVFILIILLCHSPVAFAEKDYKPLYEGFPPVEESRAFEKLLSHPITDLSVLHYLIDRYENSKIRIHYGPVVVDAPFAGKISHWYLQYHYEGETVEEWIYRWCHRTVLGSKLIWVALPDGKFRLSKDILLEELEELNLILKARGLAPAPPA